MIDNSCLVYIDDVEEKDALQLNPDSLAKIIVNLQNNAFSHYSFSNNWVPVSVFYEAGPSNKEKQKLREISEKFDRLWQALYSIHSNLTVLVLDKIASVNVTKLAHFPTLEFLSITDCDCSGEAGEDLAESINSWGPNPPLTSCVLNKVPIPRAVMIALSKCTNLKRLSLACRCLSGKLQ